MHYVFVIADDYSRFTWVYFLMNKNEACDVFKAFSKRVENEKGFSIIFIRSDHGGEFINSFFVSFCISKGTSHNFSAPMTP